MEYYVRIIIAAVLFMALAGCAATADLKDSFDAEPAAETVMAQAETEPAAEPEAAVAEREPTDPDVMFQVLAGELAGATGDVAGALENYLEATLNSNDPKIAQRTTELGMRSGNWQLATMAADRWTVLAEDDPNARAAAVTTSLRVGDYFSATRHLDELFRIRADRPGGAWEEAALMLGTGASGEKAKEMMLDLLARHGATDDTAARMAQSRLAMTLGEPELAKQLVEEALQSNPANIELLMWAGRLAVVRNEPELALDYFARAHKVEPANETVTLRYAELLIRSDRYKDAQELLATLDQRAEIVFSRVVYATEAEDEALATRLFEELQHRPVPDGDPNHAFFTAQTADILRLSMAAVQWYQLVPGGDHWLRARLRLAVLLTEVDSLEAGRQALSALKIDQRGEIVEQGFLADSQLLLQAGEADAAIQSLTLGLSRLQNSDTLRYSRALLYTREGQLDNAEEDLRSVIEINPDHVDALNTLGYTLADLTDRHSEALPLIERALELRPNDPAIIDSMGWVLFRLGKLERAQIYLEQALALSNNAEIAAHLGEVLWTLGQQEQALLVMEDARRQNPDHPVLIDTLQRLGITP
jgi:tetratricopeptide (TPR) repeat protein